MNRIRRICCCLAAWLAPGAAVAPPAVLRPRPVFAPADGCCCMTVIAGLAMLATAACGHRKPGPLARRPAARSAPPPPGLAGCAWSLSGSPQQQPRRSPRRHRGSWTSTPRPSRSPPASTRHGAEPVQHTAVSTLPQSPSEIGSFKQPLSAADIILVGIAHNSFELNADAPAAAPVDIN